MQTALPDSVQSRVRSLALGQGFSGSEIHRAIVSGADGAEPFRCSYAAVLRFLKLVRSEPVPAAELTPYGLARRIMRQLDLQLARIEAGSERVDLDQLDRIARTLRSIEPIRTASPQRQTSSLQGLVSQDQTPAVAAGAADRNGLAEQLSGT